MTRKNHLIHIMSNNTDNEYNKWIEDFETQEKTYKTYYNEDNEVIRFYFIYMDTNKQIETIRKESFILSKPNRIAKEELVDILKKNTSLNEKQYALHSIDKYNFSLDSSDISNFLREDNNSLKFITPITKLDTIYFEKTITMMQDLNDIYVFYIKKEIKPGKANVNNTTRRVVFTDSSTKKNRTRKSN